jgi:signal transduction histidine kinase
LLSGFTLRPIHRVTKTAQAIGEASDLGRRVEYSGPQDEVGQLATTFNAMLIRLQSAYQQVERSLQQQRDFVADVSHELRTPLTTIRGNLGLLLKHPPLPAEEREDVLNDMVDESDRMIRLVNELLELAHADAGAKLRREAVPLEPLIEEITERAHARAPDRTVVSSTDRGVTAVGDPDALRQILWILTENALVHTTGPVQIVASTAGSQVWVAVHDQGPGIPAELQPRLFDRFYRGSASQSKPGFGLGLAIAKRLADAQDGTITVDSAAETGTMFTLELPGTRGSGAG